jgi:hypothetical protein
MPRKTASCLVGLIVIETLPHGPARSTPMPEGVDATLAGLLAYLASGGRATEAAGDSQTALPPAKRMPARHRLDPGWNACSLRRSPAARMSADLAGLVRQLEGAWRQARRRVSRAARAAR